ncbi:Uncharacterized protein PECH_004513 [Penicillium ucsense]|uniref:Glycoside hydrolase family 43 protein n=1 Tax=Penicillium ucsense TaxID=2839758 RepID=A0A8J8WJY6_9EURO|nr:Uncharacterized protein PECM_004782 [Penicillium ucsense]KAF7737023.1 Uncharacterized protein PECH_004513 [Penicillium ucsense]
MRPVQHLCLVLFALAARGQNDTLGLGNGYTSLATSNFDIKLVQDSQILASLKPRDGDFDFMPFDDLVYRAANGQYHNGDITFRYRASGASTWISADSSRMRRKVKDMPTQALSAADLSATLPSEFPLQVVRTWSDLDGDLGLAFTVTNRAKTSVEIGSLGFPTEFNSIFTNRTAEEMAAKCSLADPYIGMDAGYLQVSPTSGEGPALIVTPLTNTSTPFEAWRNLNEPSVDPLYYGSQTFEGFYEWQIHSKAYAENEWSAVTPWNRPTSRILKPGQAITYGLRFSLVKNGIRGIQKAVQSTNTPVAIGIPGYVVPADMTARLFTLHGDIENASSDDNAFKITHDSNRSLSLTPTGSRWGRASLTITYLEGKIQTVHYFITDPAPAVLDKLGEFTTTSMWYNETSDLFGRAPSVMTWDHSLGAQVLQDPRVWIAGLSDEGGVIYLASTMKQFGSSSAPEIARLESFVDEVLFKRIQSSGLPVRKSLFFYEPSQVPTYQYDQSIDWGNWWSWNKDASYSTDRAYDYIHVIGAYWALYRAGRADESLLKVHPWTWYLSRAYNTTIACFATDSSGRGLVSYSRVGLMGETVVGELLADLRREGWAGEADAVEAAMKIRAEAWDIEAVPYGSEMAWDSTGQEGIYYWSNYFNFTKTATKTINSILGFMPTVAHWGWNGNARRYWDFIYAGKLQRIERMIHHYGSSLNALPLLSQFRQTPADTHLLRVGYGGITGPLSNIRQDGSMYNGFHSFPDTLRGDDYSGDFGPTFLGMMLGSGVYVVHDPDVGLVTYGGDMNTSSSSSSSSDAGGTVTVQPRDAVRRRVYVADLGIYVTIDAGQIQEFSLGYQDGKVRSPLQLQIVPGPAKALSTVIWIETPATSERFQVDGHDKLNEKRGGWSIDLDTRGTHVVISQIRGI